MKKICFIDNRTTIGGVTTYLYNNLRFLADKAKLHLINPDIEVVLRDDGSLRSVNIIPYNVIAGSAGQVFRDINERMLEIAPDVISLSNPFLLIPLRRVLRSVRDRHRSKVILTLHSGLLHTTLRRVLGNLCWQALLGLVDEIVYVSKYTKRLYTVWNPLMLLKDSRVVPNGVDVDGIRAALLHKEHGSALRVSFAGRFSKEKDPELFCLIARRGSEDGGIVYQCFGEGALENRLRQMYGDVVRFCGVATPEYILGKTDILVNTSPVENCPYAVLEAKCAGVPVIAASTGGLTEIVSDGSDGILVSRRRVKDYVLAISALRESYGQYSAKAKSSANDFDLARLGSRMWGPYLGGTVSRDLLR